MLPNFIIGGATRSGTTSLYFYLKQHPEIGFPSLKEPRYFSSVDLTLPQRGPGDNTVDQKLILDFASYEKLFEHLGDFKIIGEASSEYLSHPEKTPDRIKEKLGDIPILFILRNPVERAYSAYNNLRRDGRETEPFEKALEKEARRMADNWDIMWAYKYVGQYYEQVKKYTEVFSKIKIIIFEEFIQDPQKHLKDIFEFLNVSTDVKINTETTYSKSGAPKNKIIGKLADRKNPFIYFIRTAVFKFVPRRYLEKIADSLFSKGRMLSETKQYLQRFYSEDITKLESLINKDLSFWRE